MILLVGAGGMSQAYAKVLMAQNKDFVAVGRSQTGCDKFRENTGVEAVSGGVETLLTSDHRYDFEGGIIATGIDSLAETAKTLISNGITRLLVEKPAGVDEQAITELNAYAIEKGAEVYVAYNRRFYTAAIEAQRIIVEDGGVSSFNFELTEWGHRLENGDRPKAVNENWFIANTSHVVDLAFFLGGAPETLSCYFSGTSSWHTRSYNYAGAGIAKNGALFSYNGNWGAPGRWSVEILTLQHRLIFRPMEQLQIQKLGSVSIEPVDLDYSLDEVYKPGLYKQTEAFLCGNSDHLCSLSEHSEHVATYADMAGYK